MQNCLALWKKNLSSVHRTETPVKFVEISNSGLCYLMGKKKKSIEFILLRKRARLFFHFVSFHSVFVRCDLLTLEIWFSCIVYWHGIHFVSLCVWSSHKSVCLVLNISILYRPLLHILLRWVLTSF